MDILLKNSPILFLTAILLGRGKCLLWIQTGSWFIFNFDHCIFHNIGPRYDGTQRDHSGYGIGQLETMFLYFTSSRKYSLAKVGRWSCTIASTILQNEVVPSGSLPWYWNCPRPQYTANPCLADIILNDYRRLKVIKETKKIKLLSDVTREHSIMYTGIGLQWCLFPLNPNQ